MQRQGWRRAAQRSAGGLGAFACRWWVRIGRRSTACRSQAQPVNYSTPIHTYENRPDAALSHRSSRHDGVAWLEMDYERDPDRLVGQYFTERKTSGDIEVRRVSRDVAPDPQALPPPPRATPA